MLYPVLVSDIVDCVARKRARSFHGKVNVFGTSGRRGPKARAGHEFQKCFPRREKTSPPWHASNVFGRVAKNKERVLAFQVGESSACKGMLR